MTAIYLIRHGQASFGKADYDQLSDKGMEQSRLLGKSWRAMSKPDKIYSGDLIRHGQTLEHFLMGYQGEGASVTLHSGFNEFDHVDLLSCYDPKWKDFTQMTDLIGKRPDANKIFQQEFACALDRWIGGEKDQDYKETWEQFKKRCVSALHDVIKQEITARKSSNNTLKSMKIDDSINHYANTICIFTSGGTISAIIQYILGLTDEKTLVVSQQTRNTSVTKILSSGSHLSLDYLNNYSHLTSAGSHWITFR